MYNFEREQDFAEWCLTNKKYHFDSGKFWFNTKTLKNLSWEEIWNKYNKIRNKSLKKINI